MASPFNKVPGLGTGDKALLIDAIEAKNPIQYYYLTKYLLATFNIIIAAEKHSNPAESHYSYLIYELNNTLMPIIYNSKDQAKLVLPALYKCKVSIHSS